MVTHNLGNTDVAIRRILGVVLLSAVPLAWLMLDGAVAWIAPIVVVVLAIVMFATATARFCPLYVPVGVDTRRTGRDQKRSS